MAVRPVFFDSANDTIRDMDDSDLEQLVYRLQKAYAFRMIYGGSGQKIGNIFVGSDNTAIGTATDTSSTQQTNTVNRISNNGIIETFPSHPGIGSETDTTYNFRQNRTSPDAISAANLNVNGLLTYDSANDELEPITEAGLQDYILNKAITNMRTGNEVGTFRISNNTPADSAGGAGTWADLGTIYSDTTFGAGTTNFKKWLKIRMDTEPGATTDIVPGGDQSIPLGLDSDGSGTATGNIIQRSTDSADRLIQNVLLPALQRRMSSGLYYEIRDSAGAVTGINRGAFSDTKQTGTNNTTSFVSNQYRSISSPSGTASVQKTFFLDLIPGA